jgi:hypothetical protein
MTVTSPNRMNTVQTRPSRQVAPTSKLTDPNNTERPQLTSQRKAVEAFHSRYPKEAEAKSLQVGEVANQSIATSSSAHITPSTNRSKRNLSADTDSETDKNNLVEDDSGDEQPKHCKSPSLVFISQMAT